MATTSRSTRLRAGQVLVITLFLAGILHGCTAMHAPHTKAGGPSLKVTVDRNLKATPTPLPPFADGAPRPLASVADVSGKAIDFVENELMVELASEAELAAFLARWQGTVLAVDRPTEAEVDAASTYLIRIDTSGVGVGALEADLAQLNPDGGSPLTVSSEAARRLIAAGAAAAAGGRHVGINFIGTGDGFQDGLLAEAPSSGEAIVADNGTAVEHWHPNPTRWSYMKQSGNLDVGVGPAWSLLERVGAFNRKVKIAVLDGGFGAGDDFPTPYQYNGASLAAHDPTGPNENTCGGKACRWHGWNVVNAAMGQVDNGIGAAGPGGPVASLLAVRRTADVFNNIQALTIALTSGAKIIIMSYSWRVPATLTWALIPYDLATLRASGAGKLLIASAGNDGEDINKEHCFIACWEAAWWAPCENGGVVCVGAMDAAGPTRASYSNYGDEELDIWGPGTVWVAGDYDKPSPHGFVGTSAAAPFIAGVAALIWAANPGLDNDGVEQVLYETAHQGSSGEVERWPNLYKAITRALGGTPPEISIAVAWAQTFGACQPEYVFTATVTDPDDGPPTVTWTSDLDGVLGSGNSLRRGLSAGTHHITATAVDGKLLTTHSNGVMLSVVNPPVGSAPRPRVDIVSLNNHQVFAANQSVTFEAGGSDPAVALGTLLPANLRWTSSRDGELGSGQRIYRQLSVGSHYIVVNYTGKCGGTADDLKLIEVQRAVADAPPNMSITTPNGNDLLVSTVTGEACLRVAGFGFDEEDQDFATIEWWETDRSDLQWKVLSFEQNTTVCLKLALDGGMAVHNVVLRGVDRTGNRAVSAPLRVTVIVGPR